jgi:hypothetical protein
LRADCHQVIFVEEAMRMHVGVSQGIPDGVIELTARRQDENVATFHGASIPVDA